MMNNKFSSLLYKGKFAAALAPMAGFTDAPFRKMCSSLGADFTVSEMISAKAMVYQDKKTATLSKIAAGEAPVALQLFGHEPEVINEAASMLAGGSFTGADYAAAPIAIDINMGCPVKKIVSSGDGSALMKNPRFCEQLVSAAVRGAAQYGVPVTVKIRAGWSENEKNACEVAEACVSGGAAAIAVHARTRDQLYTPGIDLDVIAAVREAIPEGVGVIGNGDISCVSDALHMLSYTKCNGVMIGREALGNPWIFEEIKKAETGETFTPPDELTRKKYAYSLICEIAKQKGECAGVREARGRAAHFIKGLHGAAEMRARINTATSIEQIRQILFI